MRTSTAVAAITTTALAASAATAEAKHLITGHDIARRTISGQNIKRGAISARHLDKSLRREMRRRRGPRGFRGFQGRQGARGAQGPSGAAGAQGPAGAPGIAAVRIVESPAVSVAPGGSSGLTATCPAGTTVIGTGYDAGIGKMTEVKNYGGFFVGGFVVNDTSISITATVQAVCAQLPLGTPVASAARSRAVARWRGDAAHKNQLAERP